MTRRTRILAALSLVALCVAVYANSLGNGFAVDDGALVENNPLIRDWRNLPTLFASDYWEPKAKGGLYRPLVTASYVLDYALGGGSPSVSRAVNVLLHALNTLLVAELALFALGGAAAAWAAAALFAVHAVHSEAVAGITAGRPELLAAAFFLLALLAHRRAAQAASKPAAAWRGVSLAAYGLALLSKESAVTLLGVLVLTDLVFAESGGTGFAVRLRRLLRGRRLAIYAAYAGVVLLYLGARRFALSGGELLPPRVGIDNPLVELSFPWRQLSALDVLWRYVGLLLAPYRLAYDYSYAQIPLVQTFGVRALVDLALAALAALALARSFRRSPASFFAGGFFLITISVVSNLVLPIGTILGERLLYTPSIGFCLLVGVGFAAARRALAGERWREAVPVAVLVLLLGLHGARAAWRNRDWRSEKILYLHDLQVSSRSTKAYQNAAAILAKRGRYEEAIEYYRRAIAIRPEGFPFPYMGLGGLLIDLGEVEKGVALVEKAARMGPDDPEILGSLAFAYYKAGRYEEALAAIRKSLERDAFSSSARDRDFLRKTIEEALAGRDGAQPAAVGGS